MTRHERLEAKAARRDHLDEPGTPRDVDTVELVASERYADVLLTGSLDAASGAFTEREAAALAETIGNFGHAVAASIETTYERCTLSGFQCRCRAYTFHVRDAE